jgi:hypothetical protein
VNRMDGGTGAQCRMPKHVAGWGRRSWRLAGRGASACAVLALAAAFLVGGCGFPLFPTSAPAPVWPVPKASATSLGGTLRLRDASLGFDLSIRVAGIRLIDSSVGAIGGSDGRLLGVHLIVKNLSASPYRDAQFTSCVSLTRSLKPSPTGFSSSGPIIGGSQPPHTIGQSVTIQPKGTLDGWLWFPVRGKKKVGDAPDFRYVHVLWFWHGGSSVLGAWQLKP